MEDNYTLLALISMSMTPELMCHTMANNEAPPIDRTALANAIVVSAVEQSSKIVRHIGLVRYLRDEQTNFSIMVGLIANQLFDVASHLINEKLTIGDCSLSSKDVGSRAILELKGWGPEERIKRLEARRTAPADD